MIGTLLKGYAYAHNPRLTFAALHPGRALQLRKMEYDLEHAYAPRVTAVAAALVFLPLGIWLGRRWERAAARDHGRPRVPRVTRRSAEPQRGRRPLARSLTRPAPSPAGDPESGSGVGLGAV